MNKKIIFSNKSGNFTYKMNNNETIPTNVANKVLKHINLRPDGTYLVDVLYAPKKIEHNHDMYSIIYDF